MHPIDILIYIVKKNGFSETIMSTIQLGKIFGISQQTASRKLKELEDSELIKRKSSKTGIKVSLTKKGKDYLLDYFSELKSIFSPTKTLNGIITRGMSEGAYYIKQYSLVLTKQLGFSPFEGTLNIKVNPLDVNQFLKSFKPIYIPGFNTNDRSFGGLTCYLTSIKNIECAIIIPERSNYDETTLEIISKINLREKLKLKDGSAIILQKK